MLVPVLDPRSEFPYSIFDENRNTAKPRGALSKLRIARFADPADYQPGRKTQELSRRARTEGL